METNNNRQEADRMIRDKKLGASAQARNSANHNPGMKPECDRYGMPNEEPEQDYYPREEAVTEGFRGTPEPEPGASSSDRRGRVTADEVDRIDCVPPDADRITREDE